MTKDPHPLKKARRTPTDEEMVDIWGSDFEEELVPTEDMAGPSGVEQVCDIFYILHRILYFLPEVRGEGTCDGGREERSVRCIA